MILRRCVEILLEDGATGQGQRQVNKGICQLGGWAGAAASEHAETIERPDQSITVWLMPLVQQFPSVIGIEECLSGISVLGDGGNRCR
jgi:hypothetical protein